MSMRFGHASRDEPEINLIPFIDVLLVVLIFLMLSTTYAKFTEMQLRLPTADTEAQRNHPKEVIVTVSSDGAYLINRQAVDNPQLASLAQALEAAAQDSKDTVVIINADASARHQSVVTVMEAARRVGLTQITFATQSSVQGGKR
jgi:biopolymer transport protein ExbD